MKRALMAIFILTLILSVFSAGFCQDAEITKSVNTFYNCIEKGDLDTIMKELLTKDIVKKLADSDDHEGIGEDLGLVVDVGGAVHEDAIKVTFSNLQVKVAEKTDTTAIANATYKVTLQSEDEKRDDEGNDNIYLKKVDGRWVIEKLLDNTKQEDVE